MYLFLYITFFLTITLINYVFLLLPQFCTFMKFLYKEFEAWNQAINYKINCDYNTFNLAQNIHLENGEKRKGTRLCTYLKSKETTNFLA